MGVRGNGALVSRAAALSVKRTARRSMAPCYTDKLAIVADGLPLAAQRGTSGEPTVVEMSQESSAEGDREGRVLIVGLGNPGREHKLNRHNVGFMLLDRLSAQIGEPFSRRQMESLVAEGVLRGRRILLAKPQTYVNRSGRAVGPLIRYYRLPLQNVLVIVDDLDLPQGMLRLRASGGSGGHNGMRAIAADLNSQHFPRLRIGIGRPPGRMDPAHYVLQDFGEEELTVMQQVFSQALECIRLFVTDDIETAMTACNAASDE